MQEIERLLRDFGPWVYWAMFAYAFLKTGPLPIFAGYASTLGWLDAGPLLAAVWSGAVLGDLARFELGRQLGPAVLGRFPSWQRRAAALARVLAHHAFWICAVKRFAKGVRTPLSLAFGLSPLGRVRFAVITTVTAGAWAGSFVGLGVMTAGLIEPEGGTWLAVGGLVLLVAIVTGLGWLVHRELHRALHTSPGTDPIRGDAGRERRHAV